MRDSHVCIIDGGQTAHSVRGKRWKMTEAVTVDRKRCVEWYGIGRCCDTLAGNWAPNRTATVDNGMQFGTIYMQWQEASHKARQWQQETCIVYS